MLKLALMGLLACPPRTGQGGLSYIDVRPPLPPPLVPLSSEVWRQQPPAPGPRTESRRRAAARRQRMFPRLAARPPPFRGRVDRPLPPPFSGIAASPIPRPRGWWFHTIHPCRPPTHRRDGARPHPRGTTIPATCRSPDRPAPERRSGNARRSCAE